MIRLSCVLARGAETAIIFRYEERRSSALIKWNLANDTFHPGQAMKGYINSGKSDLSPDGTRMVYVAQKNGQGYPWIAVCSPPCLKPLVLWRPSGTLERGSNASGLFEANHILALSTSLARLEPYDGFVLPGDIEIVPKPVSGFSYISSDHERRVRDGWTVHAGNPVSQGGEEPVVYRIPVSGYVLQLSIISWVSTTYSIRDAAGASLGLEANWADVHGKDVVYSRGSKLFRRAMPAEGQPVDSTEPVELADFADLEFDLLEDPDKP